MSNSLVRRALGLLALAGSALAFSATVAPAAHAMERCRTGIFTAHSSRTYTGYVYTRIPNSVMQYHVVVKNHNVLFWNGSVNASGVNRSMFLRPLGGNATVYSPAMWSADPRSRRFFYSITISPNSDASSLTFELYAPRCS